MVRNPADAEDLAQEAYVRLHEAILNGRKIESCLAWMRGVVRHVVFQHLRKTRPDLHVTIDVEDDGAPSFAERLVDPDVSIEDRLIEEELFQESLRVLAGLPERDRECVMMYARGYTFVQIANVLNTPYEVAIKTTRNALRKTKRRIGL
jgi:RNA polymerase sigma-70 factor, ECF subfamily